MNGDRDTKPSARAATGPARVGALAGPGKGTRVAMAQGVERGKGADLAAAKARLDGLEQLYARYKLHRAVPQAFRVPAGTTSGLHGVEDELEVELRRHGFAGIAEFAAYVEQFEEAFEQAAARVTLDLLARYASKLEQERRRYREPAVVQALYAKLGGFRTQHDRVVERSQVYAGELGVAQHAIGAEQRRMPGNGGLQAEAPSATQVAAKQGAMLANAAAKIEIEALAKEYPIFAEAEVPVELRIDKDGLGRVREDQLAGFLQAHLTRRSAAVAEARAQIEGNHALIYRSTKLVPTLYAALGISGGSIFDQIVQDRRRSDTIEKLVIGMALAIVSVALVAVSAGAAVPVIAAGASMGAAGISAYVAGDEHAQYASQHALADVGYVDEPSMAWVVIAMVGAGADAWVAAKLVGKLAPAARALEAGGTLDDFATAVETLKQAGQLDDKAAGAVQRAAEARSRYAAAKHELKTELVAAAGRTGAAFGALSDPALYRALVKVAVAKLRQGLASSAAFIAELRQARLAAKLGELGFEDLLRAGQAWDQAKLLTAQVHDPALLDKLVDSGLASSIALDAPVLNQLAGLDVAGMRRLAELAHADPAAFGKYLGLAPAELAALATLDEHALLRLASLDRPQLARLSRLSPTHLRSLATLDEQALRRILALDPHLLTKLDALRSQAFARIVDLAVHDPATFTRLASFDAATLDAFGALPPELLAKLTSLDPTSLAKLAGLDAATLRKLASLDPAALAKFASLRYPDMLAKFGACELDDLVKLATLERSVLEKFGGWDPHTVANIAKLDIADIQKIAQLKVAPGQAVAAGMANFRTEQFHMGPEVFQLDSSGMKHILERHHPQYWNGSVKRAQSFLDPRMRVEDVQDAIRAVMQQNREQLIKLGTNQTYQVLGTYGGQTYTLGVMDGRIGQFYPE